MENLYINGYIKRDKIGEALRYAKYQHHLEGVEDGELRAFVEGFNKTVEARKDRFHSNLDSRDISEILEIMRRDHGDMVNDRDLQTIGNILLDKEFKF